MITDSSWPFFLLAAVVCWIVKHRSTLSACLHHAKSSLVTKPLASQRIINDIHTLAKSHEVATALSGMIIYDGASSWPPTATHDVDRWPAALRGYKTIYLALAESLPTDSPSFDHEANRMTIDQFRARFDILLQRHVDVAAVMEIFEAGSKCALAPDIRNAFYSCIAWCRHAYR